MFGEILLKKPILTSNSTKQQITLVCEFLGAPNLEEMKNISDESRFLIKKICAKNKKPPTFDKITEKIPPYEK